MTMPEDGDQLQQWPARTALIDAGFRPARLAWPVRLLRRLLWPLIRPFHFHMLDRVAVADAAIMRLEEEVRRLSALTMNTAKLHAVEARLDTAEARMDAAAGDIDRLQTIRSAPVAETARLEALEAGIHSLRDARRPVREQEVARFDRMEKRLDGLEIWADAQRRRVEHIEGAMARNDDVVRIVSLHSRLRSDLLAIGNRHVRMEEHIAAALLAAEQVRDSVLPRLAGLEADTKAIQHELVSVDDLQAAEQTER